MNVMELASKSQTLKPVYEQAIERAIVKQIRPAPKLAWTDKDGNVHNKSNVLFTLEDGKSYDFPIMNERIVYNGVTVAVGCQAWVTISKRITKKDSKNYKTGEEVASLDRVEFTVDGNVEAMIAHGATSLNITKN